MNFLKKVFFGSNNQEKNTQQKKKEPSSAEQNNEIPIEILQQLFEKSAKYIAQSSKPQSDQNKLIIYGLYKQATVGDCNTTKPSIIDFVGKSKWTVWNDNKGMSKTQAMKNYISKAVEIDPSIQSKMQSFLQDGNSAENKQDQIKQKTNTALQSGIGLKMVQQKDYSETYSHPYFKMIEKDLPIDNINRQTLMQINNSPKCYALHFAIDKQRVDLVRKFIEILSVEDILSMQDQDGTGIKEYAELIENQEIIQLINQKLGQK